MVCNISSKTIQTIIVTGCVLLCINVVPYRFVILFLYIFSININTTLDGWWHVRTTPLQCAYCCIILISHLLVDCCIYILQFNINWCIIVHAPTNIIRYERWPQAASTWQQWHKLRACDGGATGLGLINCYFLALFVSTTVVYKIWRKLPSTLTPSLIACTVWLAPPSPVGGISWLIGGGWLRLYWLN